MSPVAPGKVLGDIVYEKRIELGLTQDEYGQRYDVSGPAVFKFEKGYVRPSLGLWLKMAEDADLPERRAVLLWLKSKLPVKYQQYVDLVEPADRSKTSKGRMDYSRFETRQTMQEAASKDMKLPRALRNVLADDDLWMLFKPTGHELNLLRDMFSPLGKAKPSTYREALRLIREFTHSF